MEQRSAESWERGQTIEELTELLRLAEQVAQRLAHESHFDAYAEAHSVLDASHRARTAAENIRLKHSAE
jgi:hypothetical protein